MKRLIAVLLVICMLSAALVGCAKQNDGQEEATTKGSDATAASEGTTDFVPDIAKKDYKKEFAFAKVGSELEEDFFIPEASQNDGMTDAAYERVLEIADYLGVTLVNKDIGSWTEYAKTIKNNVSTQSDEVQLVLTHVYEGITELMSNNLIADFSEFDSINMDQSYWNKSLMDEVTLNDKYLIGYNDFCLAETHCIVFNKGLVQNNSQTLPYDMVKNKEWTLDELITRTQDLHKDTNGDGSRDVTDTYGMTGWGWTYLISFLTSSNLKIVDRDSDGNFKVAYSDNQEKVLALLDKIQKWYNADGTWFWKSVPAAGTEVEFKNETTLYQLVSTTKLITLKETGVKFGVVPYPLYDSAQTEYRSLNWNGVLVVPNTVTDSAMVGDTLEMLAYKSAPVKEAFFGKLLGGKVANAEEDSEMLEVIWGSIVSDVGLLTSNTSRFMDNLVYMVPMICEQNKNYSSFTKSNLSKAQNGLDKFFNNKK